jgi:hypothetical protein
VIFEVRAAELRVISRPGGRNIAFCAAGGNQFTIVLIREFHGAAPLGA